MAEKTQLEDSVKEARRQRREVIDAAVRVVDEFWNEELERDGTKMILVPLSLFDRLAKAVNKLREQ